MNSTDVSNVFPIAATAGRVLQVMRVRVTMGTE